MKLNLKSLIGSTKDRVEFAQKYGINSVTRKACCGTCFEK